MKSGIFGVIAISIASLGLDACLEVQRPLSNKSITFYFKTQAPKQFIIQALLFFCVCMSYIRTHESRVL